MDRPETRTAPDLEAAGLAAQVRRTGHLIESRLANCRTQGLGSGEWQTRRTLVQTRLQMRLH